MFVFACCTIRSHRLPPSFVVIAHSRFMLSLRGLYFADGGAGESELTPHWSGINFHGISSRIVGNLGATLDLSPGSGLGAVHGVSPGAMWQDASDREFESGWADEVPEYWDDPFSAGLMNLRVGMPNVVERVAQERTTKVSLRKLSGPSTAYPTSAVRRSKVQPEKGPVVANQATGLPIRYVECAIIKRRLHSIPRYRISSTPRSPLPI